MGGGEGREGGGGWRGSAWVVQYLYNEPLGRDTIQYTSPAPVPLGVEWGRGRGGEEGEEDLP